MDIINRLIGFISERSETNTIHELKFEAVVESEILDIPFFRDNPTLCGKFPLESDRMGRSIVWALNHKGATHTVILFGHHDTVDFQAYGEHQPIATDSIKLEEIFGSSDQWLYGRGSCDMKAGLAIEIELLKKSTQSDEYPNVLFLSVPDEENLSAGMRNCMPLLKELKRKYDLEYKLALLAEPHERKNEQSVVIHTGSVGKIMPYVLVKGFETHSGMPFSGLSSIGILMEIVKAIESNTEMADVIQKRMTPPPLFLGLKDLKKHYDVTTPGYAMGYFNWLYLKDNLSYKMEQLKQLCVWSVEDAINQYNYSYNEFLRKQGMPSYETCQEFKVEVILFSTLKERFNEAGDFEALKATVIDLQPDLSLQDLTVTLTKKMIESVSPDAPLVVVGLMPPFYPAVNHSDYFESAFKEALSKEAERLGVALEIDRFFMGISDMSYLCPLNEVLVETLEQMPLAGNPYQLDFCEETIPTFNIGPWGKGIHQKNECVFKDDVERVIPSLLECVLKNCL